MCTLRGRKLVDLLAPTPVDSLRFPMSLLGSFDCENDNNDDDKDPNAPKCDC